VTLHRWRGYATVPVAGGLESRHTIAGIASTRRGARRNCWMHQGLHTLKRRDTFSVGLESVTKPPSGHFVNMTECPSPFWMVVMRRRRGAVRRRRGCGRCVRA
jgi:hypothetical protein